MYEIYKFDLHLGQRHDNLITPISLMSGDEEAYQFEITINDHLGYMDSISWASATIDFLLPDGSVHQNQPVTITDSAPDKLTYSLGTTEVVIPGTVKASILLVAGATKITTQIFEFKVLENIFRGPSVEQATVASLGVPKITKAGMAPTSPSEGDFWYNTTTKLMYFWNGTAWA